MTEPYYQDKGGQMNSEELDMAAKMTVGEKLSYDSYCCLRLRGDPAIKVYQAWKDQQLKRAPDHILGEILPFVVAIGVIASIFHGLNAIRIHTIWITSPSGKTTKQLPLYQALRIIKKRKWQFTQVTPTRASVPIARKSALRILLFGSNNKKEG